MTKLSERLKKLETVSAVSSALPQLVAWWEQDGSYTHGSEKWESVDAIRAAHPGKYDPGPAMVFTWQRGDA